MRYYQKMLDRLSDGLRGVEFPYKDTIIIGIIPVESLMY